MQYLIKSYQISISILVKPSFVQSSFSGAGEYAGLVGEYAGLVGEYAGDVGLYAGDVGEYAGLVGL